METIGIVLADGTTYTWKIADLPKSVRPRTWKSWVMRQLPYGTVAKYGYKPPKVDGGRVYADHCAYPGCGQFVKNGSERCEAHSAVLEPAMPF